MASSSSSDGTFPMSTILHMLTHKLTSSNYLLWQNHMVPLLTYQKLMAHVDGSSKAPPPTIITADKEVINPAYTAWYDADQKAVIILHSSLSEEALSEVLGLSTSAQIWDALKHAYSNSSTERVQSLRDQLRHLTKGSSSVSEFGRHFKNLCDQLSAIGHSVDDMDKVHWFLYGLGPSFEMFSTAIRASRQLLVFRDLVSQAESHELFLKSIHDSSSTPSVAFTADHSRPNTNPRGRGRSSSFRGNGRGRGRRTPHCQLCRKDGHYANQCPDLSSYANQSPSVDANLAQAFHAQCHVNSSNPDWYVDSGASAHMTSSAENLHHVTPVSGQENKTDPSKRHM